MAKEETKARDIPKADKVKVMVHRAIAFGGVVVRPKVDGKKTIPVEAEIPAELVKSYGPQYVSVVK